MRLAFGIGVLVAVLVVATLWSSGPAIAALSTPALLGAALGAIVVAWLGGVWVRSRRRKRDLRTRYSALW